MRKPKVTEVALRRRLARNTRRLRLLAGLSVEAAAELAELNGRHWQKIEAEESNATLDTLTRIAGALGVDPGALLKKPLRR